ncbi:MAG: filamentous hemagglutinin N-terminal domain-containing protein, partial [Methylococcaceae bacterium]|nr:filamentous hemagglutinin N-terminal domain-containing protein [Methylococcaceae bacterium]
MKPLFIDTASIPVSEPKPLVHAIRTLIAGGFVLGVGMPQVRAELPVPVNGGVLNATPVDIAIMGKATAAINGNTLNIKQLSDKAAMDWKSFNIGSDNAVRFDQPSTTSIALNRIHDQNPSQILGSLTANGQVYLVNQNGFVFGKNSQINVNSLVATTLGISDEVFQRGITKVFDISNSPAFEGNGQLFLKNDQGQFVLDQKGEKIKIQIFIEEGAKIKTEGNGGRVIIAAPTVTNAGTIETPDGQTILVGSKDKVYLQEAGSDSDIRGLLVEVGTGGETNNVGKVIAERGNASLMGFAVNQKGIASATTSVRLNGSVRLLAREGIQSPSSTGGKLLPGSTTRATDQGDGLGTSAKVTLSKGSVTSVDLDADKSLTAIDAQAQAASTIEISGHKVLLQDQSTVQAKSGKVSIAAVDNPADPRLKGKARILLEKGSKIDVSGVKNVSLPIERNVVQVELRKNELKDAPLQREGVLFGKKVLVDLRDADLKYSATGELTSASIPLADIK